MHVAACQIPVADLDIDRNMARVTERLAALPARVDVALFPEMALTGFVADERVADAAVPLDGPHVDRLRALSADHDLALSIGMVEQAADALYNTTVYLEPDGTTTSYRKRHLWGGETAWLESGDDLVTVETPIGTVGLVTCYDLNFVEDSAAFTDHQVAALFVSGAWPAAYAHNWRLLVRARALDGTRWCVACGRTGAREVPEAPRTEYAGRTMVARPDGEVHASLAVKERTLTAELSPAILDEQRQLVGVYGNR